MNAILLFLNFLTVYHARFPLNVQDTCKVFETPISSPFREIDNYKDYYVRFSGNDSSDYQVLCISMPYDDSYGHLVYFRMDDSITTSEVGTAASMKKSIFLANEIEKVRKQLEVIETGGYGCICNMNAYTMVYSICIIKKQKNIVFQYQGINKNILALKGNEGERLKNVITLIRSLRRE
ncbi:MAG: hypothetical protein J7623_17130 [Chitinophaga sp.]|uniref:hypothetical protein n=1 Tax=Chitinophaga sp. TaxID=1869181 RepID=UPI001B10967A|nr:hypothetical protein [Chitinophaga sp.]MBO9730367.1 hypothetical protein [Chitinophaga sp.]